MLIVLMTLAGHSAGAKPALVQPPSVEAGTCLERLKASGAAFVEFQPSAASAMCQLESPVRLTAVRAASGVVQLPDHPVLNCAFALSLAQWTRSQVQPLAEKLMASSITAIGTGPGFDCRERKGDTTTKLSEHAIANAIDIASIVLANKQRIQVMDAANPQASSFEFLKALRAAACVQFTTVLGPGANSAHQEHFHVDLARRKGGYRICE